jgi:hypothetical protein
MKKIKEPPDQLRPGAFCNTMFSGLAIGGLNGFVSTQVQNLTFVLRASVLSVLLSAESLGERNIEYSAIQRTVSN